MKLVSSVEAWFMQYPGDLCKHAIENDKPWMKLAWCSIYESMATGNPFYPLFDIRNIKQECNGWFDCYQNGELAQMAMNEADIVELIGANMTYNDLQTWLWSDCNAWDGTLIKNQFNQEKVFDEDGILITVPTKIQTRPEDVFSKILNDREIKIIIING